MHQNMPRFILSFTLVVITATSRAVEQGMPIPCDTSLQRIHSPQSHENIMLDPRSGCHGTSLHTATTPEDICRLLQDNPRLINEPDLKGQTPLIAAVQHYTENRSAILRTKAFNPTAHWAVVVCALLLAGADPTQKDADGKKAADYADVPVLQTMLQAPDPLAVPICRRWQRSMMPQTHNDLMALRSAARTPKNS